MATTAEKILKELANMEARMNAKFLTKDDLKDFAKKQDLQRFATKDDLSAYATKADLKGGIGILREDLEVFKNDIMTKLDTISSTFQDTDEMLIVLGARTNEHEIDIRKIKHKVGLK